MARAAKSSSSPHPTASAAAPFSRDAVRGIQLNVTGRELAVRLGDRIRFHRERADTLIAQMAKIGQARSGGGSRQRPRRVRVAA